MYKCSILIDGFLYICLMFWVAMKYPGYSQIIKEKMEKEEAKKKSCTPFH